MPTHHEAFFGHESFAVIGHSKKRSFPRLTYNGLKNLGKTVYPIDQSAENIEGDPTFPDFSALPGPVQGVVLEVPKEETEAWVTKVAEAGVKDLWIHMGTETPEAIEVARSHRIDTHTGTCAVMYVTPGFTYHSIHKWLMKLGKKY
jgi:predicted CoA-binding protein